MEVRVILKAKVKSKLGEVLKNKGLRSEWVAKEIGATRSQLTNWSKNDAEGFAKSTPSVLYLLRLQNLLDINIKEMYEEEER